MVTTTTTTTAQHHHHQPRTHRTHTPNTYRLRIVDLPPRFARESPNSAAIIDHVIFQHLGVQVLEVLTKHKWLKVDRSRAYAFIEVEDEEGGNTVINQIHRITMNGTPLRADGVL